MIRREDAPRQHEEIDAGFNLEENLSALIRRDNPPSRYRDREAVADPTSGHLNGLLQQIADASIEAIDRIILELQGVRDMLRGKGERLSNEIARYATLNNMTMTVMRSVADRLKHSEGTENGQRRLTLLFSLGQVDSRNIGRELSCEGTAENFVQPALSRGI